MFTHRIESNIFFQYHFVIFYFKLFGKMMIRFFIQSAVNFHTHTCNSVRSIFETFTFCIFTDSFKKETDCLFYFLFVYH